MHVAFRLLTNSISTQRQFLAAQLPHNSGSTTMARLAHQAAGWIGRGIREDIRGRIPHYKDDWRPGRAKLRILAASTYIFCASVVPALAFGEQLYAETNGLLSAVQVLAAAAITGVIQAFLGGQPLLIVGVAEPIVLVYKYMYDFAKDKKGIGPELFLAWAAWACVWASAFILLLAALNACTYISRFTRFAGELFGALIAMLFLQQAVKGSVQEFRQAPADVAGTAAVPGAPSWQLVNGLWSLLLAFGLLLASLLVRTARSWRFLRSPVRALLADYGTVLMLVAFSGLSFAVSGGGVPQRVRSPNAWDTGASWRIATDMARLGVGWVFAAALPAALITILFFFDHSVSSQLAQQPEFGLRKPSAYHWDLFLLGLMTLLCGLLGLPPVNGVLPQSPMHTKALARVVGNKGQGKGPFSSEQQERSDISIQKRQQQQQQQRYHDGIQAGAGLRRVHPSASAQALLPVADSSTSLAGASIQLPALAPRTAAVEGSEALQLSAANGAPAPAADGLAGAAAHGASLVGAPNAFAAADGSSQAGESVVAMQVQEQRLSGLFQSLAVGVCVLAMPAIRQIPTAALWGYFAFMALESLPGSQLWDRTLLMLTDPKRRWRLLEKGHAPYLETVPFRVIAWFTALQLAYLLAVYGLTWAGIAGILFPVPIMLLVPLRQHAMPSIFRQPQHLQELDGWREEEAAPLPHELAVQEAVAHGLTDGSVGGVRRLSSGAGGEGAAALAGGADKAELDDSELHRFRVVHRLSRETLQHRRQSMQAQVGGSGPASPRVAAGQQLPGPHLTAAAGSQRQQGGLQLSPRAADRLRRHSSRAAEEQV